MQKQILEMKILQLRPMLISQAAHPSESPITHHPSATGQALLKGASLPPAKHLLLLASTGGHGAAGANTNVGRLGFPTFMQTSTVAEHVYCLLSLG